LPARPASLMVRMLTQAPGLASDGYSRSGRASNLMREHH
jgi:hypothetical protein